MSAGDLLEKTLFQQEQDEHSPHQLVGWARNGQVN